MCDLTSNAEIAVNLTTNGNKPLLPGLGGSQNIRWLWSRPAGASEPVARWNSRVWVDERCASPQRQRRRARRTASAFRESRGLADGGAFQPRFHNSTKLRRDARLTVGRTGAGPVELARSPDQLAPRAAYADTPRLEEPLAELAGAEKVDALPAATGLSCRVAFSEL